MNDLLMAACVAAACLGWAGHAGGQPPPKRVVGPPDTARLTVTDARGRATTVEATLPRPRLALRQERDAEGSREPAPGLRWLVPAQKKPEADNQQPAQQEEIPSPDDGVRIPLVAPDDAGEIQVTGRGSLISLVARDASLNALLTMLAEHTGLNIVLTDATNAQVTITLKDVRLEDALDAILSITGNTWTRKNNIILVSNISNAGSLATGVQGTVTRVFQLDYASASDVAEGVAALLSPLGRSFINQMDRTDNHKTKEMVVVEDLPHVVRQIENYIRQMDVPPRQVCIQAHVLQIDLKRTDLHGVNLNRIFSLLGHQLQLQTLGFANSSDTTAFMGSFNGNEMGVLIECLQSIADAKTLAQPKLLCLNGQEAKFQVGQKLGYRLISTSQTSTLQSVNFLNVGVILNVTPRISRDDQIMMSVKPEVSTGSVDQTSGLPSSNTTTVETDVLLPNGRGLVIGGLIQETDNANISKIPGLGDIWLLGRLFQKRNIVRERTEVVIFLVPRIVPFDVDFQAITEGEMARAQMPLLGEQFARQKRPGEPQLYDTVENPRSILPRNQPAAASPTNRSLWRRVTQVFSTSPQPDEKAIAAPPPALRPAPQIARATSPQPVPPVSAVNPRPAPSANMAPPGPPGAAPAANLAGRLPPWPFGPKPAAGPPANSAAPPRIPKAGEPAQGSIDFPPPPPKSTTRWAGNLNSDNLVR